MLRTFRRSSGPLPAPQTQQAPQQKTLCMSRSCRVHLRQEWETQGISMQKQPSNCDAQKEAL